MMLVFIGANAVVGDATKAAELARTIPNSTVGVIEPGHLIGAKQEAALNSAMVSFLAEADAVSQDHLENEI